MAFTKVAKLTGGTYYAQIRSFNGGREIVHYETSEYVTKRMAQADADCWRAFHMTDTPKKTEYSIDVSDTVETFATNGGKPRQTWTGPGFATWLSRAQATFPEMTYRVGIETPDGHKAKGNDFFLFIKTTPTKREHWFTVRKD